MKTIGKIAALAMVLSLAFVLTACGGSSSSSAASSASASSSSASASASASSASASASASASSDSVSASEADTYVNEYFGIQFNKPADWSFMETADLNGTMSSMASNASVDMVAASSDSSSSVVVCTETGGTGTAADRLKEENEQIESSLSGDYSISTTEATITFEGYTMELPATFATITANGTSFCIGTAFAEKEGNFLEIITFGADEDAATKAFEYFSAIG